MKSGIKLAALRFQTGGGDIRNPRPPFGGDIFSEDQNQPEPIGILNEASLLSIFCSCLEQVRCMKKLCEVVEFGRPRDNRAKPALF